MAELQLDWFGFDHTRKFASEWVFFGQTCVEYLKDQVSRNYALTEAPSHKNLSSSPKHTIYAFVNLYYFVSCGKYLNKQ